MRQGSASEFSWGGGCFHPYFKVKVTSGQIALNRSQNREWVLEALGWLCLVTCISPPRHLLPESVSRPYCLEGMIKLIVCLLILTYLGQMLNVSYCDLCVVRCDLSIMCHALSVIFLLNNIS